MNIETAYRRYGDYIYRYIYGMVQNKAEAEDLLQDTFVKVAKSDLDKVRNMKSWLITVARNTVYDHWRKESKWKFVDLFKPFPRKREEDLDLRMDIEKGIHELSPKLREVFILREINQLSYDEISNILDIELGTVKSRLNRARKQLREILGG